MPDFIALSQNEKEDFNDKLEDALHTVLWKLGVPESKRNGYVDLLLPYCLDKCICRYGTSPNAIKTTVLCQECHLNNFCLKHPYSNKKYHSLINTFYTRSNFYYSFLFLVIKDFDKNIWPGIKEGLLQSHILSKEQRQELEKLHHLLAIGQRIVVRDYCISCMNSYFYNNRLCSHHAAAHQPVIRASTRPVEHIALNFFHKTECSLNEEIYIAENKRDKARREKLKQQANQKKDEANMHSNVPKAREILLQKAKELENKASTINIRRYELRSISLPPIRRENKIPVWMLNDPIGPAPQRYITNQNLRPFNEERLAENNDEGDDNENNEIDFEEKDKDREGDNEDEPNY